MPEVVSGRTLLSHRPNARTFVLWRFESETGTYYQWPDDKRLYSTMSDAYDAIGRPPDQTPNAKGDAPGVIEKP